MFGHKFRIVGMLAMGLATTVLIADVADARRGGSAGSRGMRTHTAPTATPAAPNYVPPVQRSMTQAPKPAPAANAASQAARPAGSKFGGFGGGLMGGLLAGGLIGALMGNGLGGLGGFSGILMALLQAAMIGGLIWFAIRLFRRRAGANSPANTGGNVSMFSGANAAPAATPAYAPPAYAQPTNPQPDFQGQDIAISRGDQFQFEQLLSDVQDAFGREDYASLRARTTPEMMSYLAEELSQNAINGRKNEVHGTRLVQADVAEAWSEDYLNFASIAMRYESVDVMRDRATGAVIEGDADRPTETTEIWTFVREGDGPWKLSAIQEA